MRLPDDVWLSAEILKRELRFGGGTCVGGLFLELHDALQKKVLHNGKVNGMLCLCDALQDAS